MEKRSKRDMNKKARFFSASALFHLWKFCARRKLKVQGHVMKNTHLKLSVIIEFAINKI